MKNYYQDNIGTNNQYIKWVSIYLKNLENTDQFVYARNGNKWIFLNFLCYFVFYS